MNWPTSNPLRACIGGHFNLDEEPWWQLHTAGDARWLGVGEILRVDLIVLPERLKSLRKTVAFTQSSRLAPAAARIA